MKQNFILAFLLQYLYYNMFQVNLYNKFIIQQTFLKKKVEIKSIKYALFTFYIHILAFRPSKLTDTLRCLSYEYHLIWYNLKRERFYSSS
jgi:hypothetical protein